MRMWEAIETYMARKQPLIIVAGADYGQGSSRDWAAKGVRLAGVEVVAGGGVARGGRHLAALQDARAAVPLALGGALALRAGLRGG